VTCSTDRSLCSSPEGQPDSRGQVLKHGRRSHDQCGLVLVHKAGSGRKAVEHKCLTAFSCACQRSGSFIVAGDLNGTSKGAADQWLSSCREDGVARHQIEMGAAAILEQRYVIG
jgi:hypothetical protein